MLECLQKGSEAGQAVMSRDEQTDSHFAVYYHLLAREQSIKEPVPRPQTFHL